MVTPNSKTPIKSLASLPRGAPVDARVLRELGASSSLASHYVRSGWLARLGRGVFMFPGDQLEAAAAVKFLGRHLPGLHVGGKTALAWRGVRHNVGPRERLVLWGNAPGALRLATSASHAAPMHRPLPPHSCRHAPPASHAPSCARTADPAPPACRRK